MLQLVKNKLSKNLYTISLYARQVAGTVVLLFIVRFLSVRDYGLFSSYNQIAFFILMLANLGYSEYILISSKKNVKETQLKIGLFIVISILTTLIYLVIFSFLPFESNLIFALVLIRFFLDGIFFNLMLPYYQASGRFNLISYINIFYSVMTISIALACYILHLSLMMFLILSIILGIINFIQCSIYAKINYFLSVKCIKKLFKKLDKTIMIYMGNALVCLLYSKVNALYVATFIDKEQAALFFAAYAISNIMSTLIGAQYQKIIPDMMNVNTKTIKIVLKKNIYFMVIINLVLLVIFFVIGKHILLLLYSKNYYINALPYLLWLTVGNIGISFATAYGAYLTASGNQKVKLTVMTFASIISLVSLVIFYKLGLYAAIISFILSAWFMGIMYYNKSTRILRKQELRENYG